MQARAHRDGFMPKLMEYELKKKFKNKFVFAVDMGDLFGRWVPKEWILKVIKAVYYNPESHYLFLTKNPSRYYEFIGSFPRNLVLGATIETNRSYQVSNAPPSVERYYAMSNFRRKNKLISIEPILDFDLEELVKWMKEIRPRIVYLGYDNYYNNLPESSAEKTKSLIKDLETFTKVKIQPTKRNQEMGLL